MVELKGQPGVLTTLINWDNVASDVNIDVFDAFGEQIAASPVRGKGEKQKKLFTQIDKPGTYYVRVTAPTTSDGTRLHDGGEVGGAAAGAGRAAAAAAEPSRAPPPPTSAPAPRARRRASRASRASGRRARSIEARVVSAYREGGGAQMHIDKGSAAGIRPGMTGHVLQGSSAARIRSTAATSAWSRSSTPTSAWRSAAALASARTPASRSR